MTADALDFDGDAPSLQNNPSAFGSVLTGAPAPQCSSGHIAPLPIVQGHTGCAGPQPDARLATPHEMVHIVVTEKRRPIPVNRQVRRSRGNGPNLKSQNIPSAPGR